MGDITDKCSECLSREQTIVFQTFTNENINKKTTQSKRLESSSPYSPIMQYLRSTNTNNSKITSNLKINHKKIYHQINKSHSPYPLMDESQEYPQILHKTNTKIMFKKFQNLNSAQNNYNNKTYFDVNEISSSKSNKNIFSTNLNYEIFKVNNNYIQNTARKTITGKFHKKNHNNEKLLIKFDLDEENKLIKETLKVPKYLKQNFENEHYSSNFSYKKRKAKDKIAKNKKVSTKSDKKHYILTPEQIEAFGRKWYEDKMKKKFPKDGVINIEDIGGEEALKIKKYYFRRKTAGTDSRRRRNYNNCKTIKLWPNIKKEVKLTNLYKN